MFGFFVTHQLLSLLNLIPSVLDPSKGLFGPEYPGNFRTWYAVSLQVPYLSTKK